MIRLRDLPQAGSGPGDGIAGSVLVAIAACLFATGCADTSAKPPLDPGVRQTVNVPGPVSPDFNVVIAKPISKPGSASLSDLPPAPVLQPLQFPEQLEEPVKPVPPTVTPVPALAVALPSAPLAMPAGLARPTAAPIPTPAITPAAPTPPAKPGEPASQVLAALPAAPPLPPPAPVITPVAIAPAATEAATRAAGELARRKFQVIYPEQAVAVPDGADTIGLLTELAGLLKTSEKTRLQVQSFASGSSDSAVDARRRSMERAEAVREFLVRQGVRRGRIDLRPLGLAGEGGPADRIDLVPIN